MNAILLTAATIGLTVATSWSTTLAAIAYDNQKRDKRRDHGLEISTTEESETA